MYRDRDKFEVVGVEKLNGNITSFKESLLNYC